MDKESNRPSALWSLQTIVPIARLLREYPDLPDMRLLQ